MHAPTARTFGLRAATNRAKKARSRGLPAFDSRVRRRPDLSLTLFYGFLDFASYNLTGSNAYWARAGSALCIWPTMTS
jgi:hypothetical protein